MGGTRKPPKSSRSLKSPDKEKNEDDTNITAVTDMFYLFFKATGITFAKTSSSRAYSFSIMFTCGTSALMLYFLYQTFLDVYKSHVMITKSLYIFTTISAIITLITVNNKRYKFVEACEQLTEVDKVLEVSTYKLWIYLSAGMMLMLMAIQIVYYTMQLLEDFSKIKILLVEYWSFTYAFVVHIYIILLFTTFLMMIRERFQTINKLVKNFDNTNNIKMLNKKKFNKKKELNISPTNSLSLLTELHYKLCECTESLNETFTVPLFLCVHILYAEIIYIAYTYKFMYNSILEDYHFILCCICFTVNMIILLLCTYATELEARNTFLLLGDVSIFYYDGDMAQTRNTLLLQGLHKKICLNICSIYPLSLSVIIEEMSTITTIVLFLID